MDLLDLKILLKLSENSRKSFAQIARELGVSESTVYLRVKKLFDEGVLKGFTVDVDYNMLGFGVEAFVELKPLPKSSKYVINELTKIPNILELYEVSGNYPLLAKVIARNNEELSAVIDMISSLGDILDLNVRYVFKSYVKKGVSEKFEVLSYVNKKSSS